MVVGTVALLAAEEGGESTIALLLPETAELIGGIIAFGVLYFFVWKWATPAISRALEARQAAIKADLWEAEAAKVEAERLRGEYEEQLAAVKAQKTELLEVARQEADSMKAGLLAKAEVEAAQVVTKARADAAGEMTRVMADARAEIANLSIDLAEKVVGTSLDRKAQLGLIESYLADLEK